MKMIKIKISFYSMAEGKLLLRAQTILAALTGNQHFVLLIGFIDTLKTLLDNYSKCVVEASQTRSKTAIASKNECLLVLVNHLEVLGLLVCGVAHGDLEILSTSGFEMKAPRGSKGKKAVVLPVIIVTRGASADEAEVLVQQKKNSKTFNFDYSSDDPSVVKNPNWVRKASDAKKFLFSNLPLETKLWFRVEAVGDKGQTAYSNNVLYMAY